MEEDNLQLLQHRGDSPRLSHREAVLYVVVGFSAALVGCASGGFLLTALHIPCNQARLIQHCQLKSLSACSEFLSQCVVSLLLLSWLRCGVFLFASTALGAP